MHPHMTPYTRYHSSPRAARGNAWNISPTCWAGITTPTPRRHVTQRQGTGAPHCTVCRIPTGCWGKICMDCLCKCHEIQTAAFHLPYVLFQSTAPAIPDVECPDGEPGWAWGPAEWWRRRCVQATGALGGRSVEDDCHPCWGKKWSKNKGNPRTG